MLAFEMSALFSGLTPIPLKFLRNSRAREKDTQILPLSFQLLFYSIRFANFLAGSPQLHDPITAGSKQSLPLWETTTTGTTSPALYKQCVGYLTSHRINLYKGCETGPTIYRPYPRRIKKTTLNVFPAGVWTSGLPLGRPGHIYYWPNRAAVKWFMIIETFFFCL